MPRSARLTFTDSFDEAAAVDVVIEAVPEQLDLKIRVFRDLDRVAPAHTILASNTSGFPIQALAAATDRPGRVIGWHWASPAPVMKLAEIVRTTVTDDATIATISDMATPLWEEPRRGQRHRVQLGLRREPCLLRDDPRGAAGGRRGHRHPRAGRPAHDRLLPVARRPLRHGARARAPAGPDRLARTPERQPGPGNVVGLVGAPGRGAARAKAIGTTAWSAPSGWCGGERRGGGAPSGAPIGRSPSARRLPAPTSRVAPAAASRGRPTHGAVDGLRSQRGAHLTTPGRPPRGDVGPTAEREDDGEQQQPELHVLRDDARSARRCTHATWKRVSNRANARP